MNNFDENQNINTSEIEEVSTIFSDPLSHKTVADGKRGNGKKRLLTVIAGLLSVAILICGVFAVVKLVPKMEDDGNTTTAKITVLEIADKNIKKITLTNKNGTFDIKNAVSKNDDGEEVYTWSLNDYKDDVISQTALSDITANVLNISALREITSKTAEQCGLENPQVKAEVLKSDETTFSVLIGDKSPDNSGVYVKLSTQDKIYLVSGDIDTRLTFTTLDLANTESILPIELGDKYSKYLANGVVATFDKLTITGKNFGNGVVFVPNNNEDISDVVPFLITSPVERIANNVEHVMTPYNTGIAVSGAYALDASAQTLNSLGFNSPDIALTAKFDDYSYSFKFKKQSDGGYAVWHTDCQLILKVEDTALELFKCDTVSFYSPWVALVSIDDLNGLDVVAEGKQYKFDIKVDTAEDAKEKYIINYNGKKLTASIFQEFYLYCISLEASDFAIENVNGTPEYQLTFNYSAKGKKSTVVKFYRISDTKYQYSVDGEMIGKINATDVIRMREYVENAANNKEFTLS